MKMRRFEEELLSLLRKTLGEAREPLQLHEPEFNEADVELVTDCVRSGWVSSVGKYVDQFERDLEKITGARRAVAVCNGTAALHVCLKVAGVEPDDEVLVPSLTFVATANAIRYQFAIPHFVDVETATLGVDPDKLRKYLEAATEIKNNQLFNIKTGRKIKALIVMHAFGHPCRMEKLVEVAQDFKLELIEDAAESLGSYYKNKHTGTFARLAALSFNGNKIVTTGGGGAVLISDEDLGKHVKHLTTTAKLSHPWAFNHDEVGYNYRLPNLNAALGCAQLRKLGSFVEDKRKLANRYLKNSQDYSLLKFCAEPADSKSNYWLNTVLIESMTQEDQPQLFEHCHKAGYITRPAWTPLHRLKMYSSFPKMDLTNTEWLAARLVNLPSSAKLVRDI